MGENKRYFWLKLKEDFFRQKEIKKLRKIAGGDTYTIIYLKMLLKSLSNNGILFFEGVESDFIEELALDIDEEEENVSITVQFLISQGILVEIKEDEYLLTTCADMVGSESSSALRMRRHRKVSKTSQSCALPSQCDTDVTSCDARVTTCDTEIEIEKEIEKEKELNKENIIAEIIAYLNKICGTCYRTRTTGTRTKIVARFEEGYTVDDFKVVIDKKANEWKGTDMEKYLRPETLFGSKFENYLNQRITKGGKTDASNRTDAKGYDASDYYGDTQSDFSGF